MRLSVVSVVSFQGLFGVEVRTYKVFENKYLVAAGRREDFSQNHEARPCTPSRPRKHLCTCNGMTARYDGKTVKMEVNEFLGRFEKVRIVQATLFSRIEWSASL